ITEVSSRVAAVETGEVHIAKIPNQFANDVVAATGGRVQEITFPWGQTVQMGGNFWGRTHPETKQKLEADPGFSPQEIWVGDPDDVADMEQARKFRQALAIAIDRDLIVEQILGGLGTSIYTYLGFTPDDPQWKEEWLIPHDPDGARQLLTESDYDGSPVPFLVHPDSPLVEAEVGEAVAQMWRDVGVNVQSQTPTYSSVQGTRQARELNIPWLFVNAKELGLDGGFKVGHWTDVRAGWNGGGSLPYDCTWEPDYLCEIDGETWAPGAIDDLNLQRHRLDPAARVRNAVKQQDWFSKWRVHIPVVDVPKLYVVRPEVQEWTPWFNFEGISNSFETVVMR
ncbi:MAG: ABC transporter substrate-binding protein, partial [Dehalococcoidia bacterium]